MTASAEQFVQTGQTFTSDGAAFCPIERKRRGPMALAASMAVLLVGAGFLTFAMMRAPAPAPNLAIGDGELTAPRVVIPVEPLAIQKAEKDKRSSVGTPPEGPAASDAVAEALAQSRAARSTSPAAQIASKPSGLVPSLAPRRASAQPQAASSDSDAGFAPSLKPAFETTILPTPPARAQAASADGVFVADRADRPAPFYSEMDAGMKMPRRPTAPVRYAVDIDFGVRKISIEITKGENFVDALKRAGVSAADRNEAAYAFGEHYNLRRLRPGQTFHLTLGWPRQTLSQIAANGAAPEARLLSLEFRADPENRIYVRRDKSGGLAGASTSIPLTTRALSVAGRIDGSLYLSAKAAGAPDQVIADLADAFAYDVDFQREIFGGDEFEAIFEARYDDQGTLVSSGDILYARLNWRGRSREKGYYRFAEDGDGRADFFDATGQSAKRLLMKTPIDGARLSSRFGTRKHPILGYRRAHKGVDFAASRGTPIKAAGDGVIERADRYGSFGNYIRIRHANGYKTAYAHLNGFRRGIRKGKRVRQGDIIGYVGTTGRSTGPHLHYEVHHNGKAVNPQKLKIATGKQLKGDTLVRFQMQRALIDAMRTPPQAGPEILANDDRSAKGAL